MIQAPLFEACILQFKIDSHKASERNNLDSIKNLSIIILLSLFTQPAWSEGLGVSLNLGTSGWGLDVATGINDKFDARLGFYTTKNIDFTFDQSTDYKKEFNSRKELELLADWHPFENGFRTSFGLIYYHADHKLTKASSISQVTTITTTDPLTEFFGTIIQIITLGLVKTDPSTTTTTSKPWADFGTHTYDVRYRAIAPYLGIGYGSQASKKSGLGFTADIGAFYRGAPTVNSSFACGSSNPVGSPTCSAYQDSLSAESVNMKAHYARWMPKVKLGIAYNF